MSICLPESVACLQLSIKSRYHIDPDSASLHNETPHEGTLTYLSCKAPEIYLKGGTEPAKCRLGAKLPWQ